MDLLDISQSRIPCLRHHYPLYTLWLLVPIPRVLYFPTSRVLHLPYTISLPRAYLHQSWSTLQKQTSHTPRRVYELPIREPGPGPSFTYPDSAASAFSSSAARRTNYHQSAISHTGMLATGGGVIPSIAPPCRNWNYRECCSSQCRYQHACITCGSGHKASQCPSANNTPSQPLRNGPYGR